MQVVGENMLMLDVLQSKLDNEKRERWQEYGAWTRWGCDAELPRVYNHIIGDFVRDSDINKLPKHILKDNTL